MTSNEMQTTGATLRTRRQERGITLEDVAARTRIRRRYLQALEEDRYDILPGEAYRAGFLRIYAELLDLDPAELTGNEPPPPPPPHDPPVPPVSRSLAFDIKGKKTLLLVLGSVCLIFAALTMARLLRSPSPSENRATVAGKTNAAVAQKSSEGLPVLEPEGGEPIAEAPVAEPVQPSATSMERPQTQVAAAEEDSVKPASTESADIAPGTQEKPVSASVVKSGNMNLAVETGILRVEATGATDLVLQIDELGPRKYHLIEGAQLSWKFSRSAHLQVGDPAKVNLWIDHRPLDLSGRPELLLSTVMETQ